MQTSNRDHSDDTRAGIILLLPLTPDIFARVERAYATAPATLVLRAFDALHLACAAENNFKEVYSNDRHFLAAAPLFELKGRNVIGGAIP